MHSVSSNGVYNALSSKVLGKIMIQIQYGQEPIRGEWIQDTIFTKMWHFNYSLTVPEGYRFLFAVVGVGWLNSNNYYPYNLYTTLVTDLQGIVDATTDLNNLYGIIIPQFKCVFEKIV